VSRRLVVRNKGVDAAALCCSPPTAAGGIPHELDLKAPFRSQTQRYPQPSAVIQATLGAERLDHENAALMLSNSRFSDSYCDSNNSSGIPGAWNIVNV